jgi:hypothetical protein
MECSEPELAQSGEVEELLRVHTVNAGKSGACRQRHSALVETLRKLKEQCDAR